MFQTTYLLKITYSRIQNISYSIRTGWLLYSFDIDKKDD